MTGRCQSIQLGSGAPLLTVLVSFGLFEGKNSIELAPVPHKHHENNPLSLVGFAGGTAAAVDAATAHHAKCSTTLDASIVTRGSASSQFNGWRSG